MARSMPKSAPTNPAGPRREDADLPEAISRDQWGRPLIVWEPGSDPRAGTRASTLGSALEDQFGLGQWRMRMVAYGMARDRSLVLAAAAVVAPDAPDAKATLAPIADAAMERADASAKARIGTALHALSELVDRGEPTPDIGEDQAALDAYAELAAHFTMHATEVFTAHVGLQAAGTFDRLLSPKPGTVLVAPDGTVFTEHDRLIGDLKTSSTADYFGVKFAVQLAVYAGGKPYRVTTPAKGRAKARGEFTEWPDGITPSQDWGLILHVPSGGSIAELYWVDLSLGAEAAELAVTVRDWRKRKDLVLPAGLPEADPRADDALDPGEQDETVTDLERARKDKIIRTAIAGAGSDAACRALYAQFRDVWESGHTEAVKARLAELATS